MTVTLAEMLQAAADAGYGEPDVLRYRFLHLQRIGLLGPAVAKAARRGGEGLWHVGQRDLFLFHLRHLGMGVRRGTLANAPVGWWLLGWPGVRLRQVRRAMQFWVERVALPERPPSSTDAGPPGVRPAGRRSLRRQGVTSLVEQLASPDIGRPTRRRLRDALEGCLDQLPSPAGHSLDILRSAIQSAMRVDADRAQLTYERLLLRFGALGQVDLMAAERPDTTAVWEWARSAVAAQEPEPDDFLNRASGVAAEYWGVAIRATVTGWVPDAVEGPPRIDLGGAETLWGVAPRG